MEVALGLVRVMECGAGQLLYVSVSEMECGLFLLLIVPVYLQPVQVSALIYHH